MGKTAEKRNNCFLLKLLAINIKFSEKLKITQTPFHV